MTTRLEPPIDYLPESATPEQVDDWFARRIEYLEAEADGWSLPLEVPDGDDPSLYLEFTELDRMGLFYAYRERSTALRIEWERA